MSPTKTRGSDTPNAVARERRLPRFVYDREQMLASLDRLEALEKGGAKLFFGHDPDFWKDVPQAPVPAF